MPTRRETILTAVAGGIVASLPARLSAQAAPAEPPAATNEASAPVANYGTSPAFLTNFEHASLLLTLDGKRILVDPVGAPAPYLEAGDPDAILITHEHGDHFDIEALTALAGDKAEILVNPAVAEKLTDPLKARAKVLANGESGEIAGFAVEAVPAYNLTEDRLKYHPKGRDNGYVLTTPEGRIYIAGDTEDTPEFRAQKDIAYVFLPMNLPYTMTPEQAAAGIAEMQPKVAIPYHHKGTDPNLFADLVKSAGGATEVLILDWYPTEDDITGGAPL